MSQKLITFAVPCYNSAAYMRHCIETLLSAGEQAEIILVDDGSTKDDTPPSAMSTPPNIPPSSRPSIRKTAATARASIRASATPPACITR